MSTTPPAWRRTAPWSVLYACAWIAVLYLARAVLVPLTLSILLTFLLGPLVARVERFVKKRVPAVLCVMVLGTMVVAGILGLFTSQAASLAHDLPVYRETISRKVHDLRTGAHTVVGDAAEAIRAVGDELNDAPASRAAPPPAPVSNPTPSAADSLDLLRAALAPFVAPGAMAFVVIVLTGIMLVSREGIRDMVIRLAGLGQISLTTTSLEEAGARIASYLRAQLLVNAVFGLAVGLGLLAIGIPGALVCGLLAGVLRFVPFVGVLLGLALPAALAVAAFEGWTHLALVLGLYAALEIVNNAGLEPWFYGIRTGISTLGVMLCVIFWTWIWGTMGLLMALPITVCVLAFARQLPGLAPLAVVLGDEPALPEPVRFYQRLLGNDEDDALEILRAAAADHPGVDALDAVLMPALHAAKTDVRRGMIAEDQARAVARTAHELAGEFLDEPGGTGAAPAEGLPLIVCVPCADELDEAGAAILAQVLRARGAAATAFGASSLVGQALEGAHAARARVVVLSSVVPTSAAHVRRLVREARRRVPGAAVVHAAWGPLPVPGAPDPGDGNPSAPEALATTLRACADITMHLAGSDAPGQAAA